MKQTLLGFFIGLAFGVILRDYALTENVSAQSEKESFQYIKTNVYDRDTTLITTTYHQYVMISGRGKKLEHLIKCKCKIKPRKQ